MGCKQAELLEWGLASAPSTPQSSWPGLAGWGLGRSGPTAKGGECHGCLVSINKSNNAGRTSTINRDTGASQALKAFSLTVIFLQSLFCRLGPNNRTFYYHLMNNPHIIRAIFQEKPIEGREVSCLQTFTQSSPV